MDNQAAFSRNACVFSCVRLSHLSFAFALVLASSSSVSGTAQTFSEEILIAGGADGVDAMGTADLDGDGDQDVVLVHTNTRKVVFYENLGGGNFGHQQLVDGDAYSAACFAMADIDGDGDEDILVGSDSGSTGSIGWYENLGSLSFSGRKVIAKFSSGVSSLVAADLDGDGDSDIGFSQSLAGRVSWMENLNAGLLGAAQDVATGAIHAHAVNASDMDGDGDIDLLAAQDGGGEINWYPNLGGGLFGAKMKVTSAGEKFHAFSIEDWDRDGDQDVLIPSNFSGHVTWFENDGKGVFGPQITLPITPTNGLALSVRDFDGDSDLDVMYISIHDKALYWNENLGGGLFGPNLTIVAPLYNAVKLAAEDLDGDGDYDILLGRELSTGLATSLSWAENLGSGQFGALVPISTVPADIVRAIDVADLDGDGDDDLLSSRWAAPSVCWQKNDGFGNFGNPIEIDSGAPGSGAIAADLDLDGDLDVLSCSSWLDRIAWYENLGNGQFGPRLIITTQALEVSEILAVELTGDSHLDLLYASENSGRISFYRGLAGGAFGPELMLKSGGGGVSSLTTADLDNDGDLEIVGSLNGPTKGLIWFENLGNGVFGPENDIANSLSQLESVAASDLDGDGDIDLVSGSSAFGGVGIQWCENLGGGLFGLPKPVPSPAYQVALLATDLDGDGDPDIATASLINNSVSWSENLGGGVFGPLETISTGADFPVAILAKDIDGDGVKDLVSASEHDDQIAWYRNLMGPFDCNGNGQSDAADIVSGFSADCNANGVPDECDVMQPWGDLDGDGVVDTCQSHIISITPLSGPWYEASQLTLYGLKFDPSVPAEIIFQSATTPAAGDPPILAVVVNAGAITVNVPAGHASGAGLQDVILRQGALQTVFKESWRSLPSVRPELTGDSSQGGQLDIFVDSGTDGVVYLYHASALSSTLLPIPGIHSAIGLGLPSLVLDGTSPLLIRPSFAWPFGPGSLPPGLTLYYQGLVIEFPPTGMVVSFTETALLAIP